MTDRHTEAMIAALRRNDAGGAYWAAAMVLRAAPSDLNALRVIVRTGPLVGDHAGAADAAAAVLASGRATRADRLAFVARKMDVSRYDAAQAEARRLWAEGERGAALTERHARLLTIGGALNEAAVVLRTGLLSEAANPRLTAQLLALPSATADDLAKAAALSEAATSEPLHLAVARSFDRAGDPEAALRHVRRAAPLRPRWNERGERARLDWAFAQYGRTAPEASDEGPPIFYLCGPPRSGGTYLQTRMAERYQVASVGERGALPLAFRQREQGDLTQPVLAQLAAADRAGLARQAGDQPTIDKTPVNALCAGLLARVHPDARFVRNGRSLRETALSIWMHDLPPAYAYAGTLEGIARYLQLHEAALDRWAAAGMAFRTVRHETVTREPATLQTLAGDLGLAARVAPTAVTAATHSAAQVRGSGGGGTRYQTYRPLLTDAERAALDALPD